MKQKRQSPNWGDMYESKKYSFYYSILVKKYGQKLADKYWKHRDWRTNFHDSDYNIWYKVKNYKPRNLFIQYEELPPQS